MGSILGVVRRLMAVALVLFVVAFGGMATASASHGLAFVQPLNSCGIGGGQAIIVRQGFNNGFNAVRFRGFNNGFNAVRLNSGFRSQRLIIGF